MKASIPPTLKQLKSLGYADETFIALNALKNRSLMVCNRDDNSVAKDFDSQCRQIIVEYAKTITTASNLLEVVKNAQDIENVVDELYILKSAAKGEEEKLNKLKLERKQHLSTGQRNVPSKVKGLEKIFKAATNDNKKMGAFRRPSRPPPAIPTSHSTATTHNDIVKNGHEIENSDVVLIKETKKEVKIKIKKQITLNSSEKKGQVEIVAPRQKEETMGSISACKKQTVKELEHQIDSIFGQFEGLKRLTMIIGIENAVPIVERATALQNAILNNTAKNIETTNIKKDIELLKSDISILQSLVNNYTG
jgi:hypothetical protein